MKRLIRFVLSISILLFSVHLAAVQTYSPGTGDEDLDADMLQINKTFNQKYKLRFIRRLAGEFQAPIEKVESLFTIYEFTPADIIVCLSMADTSGEPMDSIAKSYFKNKKQGWKFTFKRMKIGQGSYSFTQLKKDVKVDFSKK